MSNDPLGLTPEQRATSDRSQRPPVLDPVCWSCRRYEPCGCGADQLAEALARLTTRPKG